MWTAFSFCLRSGLPTTTSGRSEATAEGVGERGKRARWALFPKRYPTKQGVEGAIYDCNAQRPCDWGGSTNPTFGGRVFAEAKCPTQGKCRAERAQARAIDYAAAQGSCRDKTKGNEGEGYAPTRIDHTAGQGNGIPHLVGSFPEVKSRAQGNEGEGYAPTRIDHTAGRARSDNPEVVEASLSFFAGY